MTAALAISSRARSDDVGFEDLRQETLHLVFVAMGGIGILTCLGIEAYLNRLPGSSWLLPISLLTVAGLGHWIIERSVFVAGLVLVGGLLVTVAICTYAFPQCPIVCVLSLVVIIAGTQLDWLAGVLTATGATVQVLVISINFPGIVPSGTALVALFVIWLALLLSWLLSIPTHTALAWYSVSYDQATRKTAEARERQAELGVLSKSLVDTHRRLEGLNRELAVARETAEQAEDLKSRLAATISHELRTPLNLIIGFSEVLMDALSNSSGAAFLDTYQGDVEAIHRNAYQLSQLIDDVLDLSQIDAHQTALNRKLVSLITVVQEATNTVEVMYRDRGLRLDLDIATDLPEVMADRTRLRQILINLLSNAARFTEDGGVTIGARLDGPQIEVTVADTGVGIAPGDLSNVFDEFWHYAPQGKRRQVGSGLGLAICKRFVEMHGGSIWVESQPGLGTTFHFSVPLQQTIVSAVWHRDLGQLVSVQDTDLTRAVLVPDRDQELGRILQRYLTGYRIIPIQDVAYEHCVSLEANPVAIVRTASSGHDSWLLHGSSSNQQNLPIFTCALLRTGTDLAAQLGVKAYLTKPVSQEQIARALSGLVARPQSILVAEDEHDMLRLLTIMLRQIVSDADVRVASDGAAALKIMETWTPDVLVLDLLMPETDGYAVLKQMAESERLHAIPVVVISGEGYEDETIVAEWLHVTRNGGLSVGELVQCLRANLDEASGIAASRGSEARQADPRA